MFESAITDIKWCDAIIWNTPVYTILVPWQLIRLLNIIKERKLNSIFKGKYATSMMTCFHYYDHLAEDWIRGISEDLKMNFIEGRTADNVDMLNKEHRASMLYFMNNFIEACINKYPVEKKFISIAKVKSPKFTPKKIEKNKKKNIELNKEISTIKTVLLTDEVNKNKNLSKMINVFLDQYPHPVEIIDINKFPYESACHGCLKCELVGECQIEDGFQDFYLNLVETCDVIVFGMNIEDRYLKPIWKLFLDRTFSNGHRTSMMKKHTGYLVSGPLRYLPSVRQFLEGKDNVGRENSMFIIGDEYKDSEFLESLIRTSANRLSEAVEAKYQKSVNFLGIGGMKIFRDLIYSMRGVVGDDHRFYKEKKLYDFPQKDIKKQIFNISMGLAFKFKPVRMQAYERMPEMYIQLHKKIIDSKIK